MNVYHYHNRPSCWFCPWEEAGTTGYRATSHRQPAHPPMAPLTAPGSHPSGGCPRHRHQAWAHLWHRRQGSWTPDPKSGSGSSWSPWSWIAASRAAASRTDRWNRWNPWPAGCGPRSHEQSTSSLLLNWTQTGQETPLGRNPQVEKNRNLQQKRRNRSKITPFPILSETPHQKFRRTVATPMKSARDTGRSPIRRPVPAPKQLQELSPSQIKYRSFRWHCQIQLEVKNPQWHGDTSRSDLHAAKTTEARMGKQRHTRMAGTGKQMTDRREASRDRTWKPVRVIYGWNARSWLDQVKTSHMDFGISSATHTNGARKGRCTALVTRTTRLD